MAYQGFSYEGSLSQPEWETFWRKKGAEKYLKKQNKLKEQGNADLTDSGRTAIAQYIEKGTVVLAEMLKVKTGKRPVEFQALMQIEPEVLVYIGLRETIRSAVHVTKEDNVKRTYLAGQIGTLVQDEERAKYLESNEEQFLKWQHHLIKDQDVPTWYKNKKIKLALDHLDLEWTEWDNKKRILVGMRVLEVLDVIGFIESKTFSLRKGKQQLAVVILSEQVSTYLNDSEEFRSELLPIHMPLLEKPKDWTCLYDGGYSTLPMSKYINLIKARRYQEEELGDAEMPDVYKAANRLQNTKYDVNRKVLDVVKSMVKKTASEGISFIPGLETVGTEPMFPFKKGWKVEGASETEMKTFSEYKTRKRLFVMKKTAHEGKHSEFNMAFQLAAEMVRQEDRLGFKGFHYIWQTDFRGRFYPVCTMLSPQGSDVHKGLLEFAVKKPLGDNGAYWLAVHGANVYGEDKLSLDDRAKWVKDNEHFLLEIAKDPDGNYESWSNADKPWQFLAFCFEWEQYKAQGEDFMSSLPVAMDGSCNGLQHYSAALLDDVGASSTNLIESDLPNDIYQDVADVLKGKLETLDHVWAQQLLKHGINRKMTKRQVMTLPYGSTLYSCNDYTLEYLHNNCKKTFPTAKERREVAHWLTPYMWESMNEVVKKGREAMDWLMECAKIVSKDNAKIQFTTPSGFKVYYTNFKTVKQNVQMRVQGEKKGFTLRPDTEKVNVAKVSNSVAPNFVHALDATHMVWTINSMPEDTQFCMVHDSYATHACDTETMNKTIREQFYKLYTSYDVFEDFKESLEASTGLELPNPPAKGNLDLSRVLNSTYFFS